MNPVIAVTNLVARLLNPSLSAEAIAIHRDWKVKKLIREGLFDPQWYLSQNRDVRSANIDAFQHFVTFGCMENRHPTKDLNLTHIRDLWCKQQNIPFAECSLLDIYKKYCKDSTELKHLLIGDQSEIPASADTSKDSLQSARFLQPGDQFEEQSFDLTHTQLQEKIIAYYLPQFYPFEENDRWWGKGFTEWTNVVRGRPRFKYHHQPKLPRDLGFYDLRNKDSISKQIAMAKKAGLFGFCYYYYWFDGKRLLDKPLDILIDNPDLDMPFCLMWANENWTRRWDGMEQDVLIHQSYNEDNDEALTDDWARYLKDSRYINLNGRPLFFIYRVSIIPTARSRIARWRALLKKRHNLEPLFFMAQSFQDIDPRDYGLDGAVEFPPHKLTKNLKPVHQKLELMDSEFPSVYYSYDQLVKASFESPPPNYELIKCVVPSWDNEARKPNRGNGFFGSTPKKFENWLTSALKYSRANPVQNEPLVFINAWNEWAEGAHLEPDVYYGSAYLNAVSRALVFKQSESVPLKVIYFGHDALQHGAQYLSLNIIDQLKNFGVDVEMVLLKGGPLVEAYQKLAPTSVLENPSTNFQELLNNINDNDLVITNTTVTGELVAKIKETGVKIISLIHELPNLIHEYNLIPQANNIANHSDHIVFAATQVQDSFNQIIQNSTKLQHILPQGIYQTLEKPKNARRTLRSSLGIASSSKIVLGVGYGNLRKGFDLFLTLAKLAADASPDLHFLWLGKVHLELQHRFQKEMDDLSNFSVIDFSNQVAEFYHAADAFALTSREDPFPSVMLEAIQCGLPVVGFANAGGCEDLLGINSSLGSLARLGDCKDFLIKIQTEIVNDSRKTKNIRIDYANKQLNWQDYVFSLLQLHQPRLQKVSVILPNYNYANHLVQRLDSILAQSYPIFEIIILDDCSTDNSVAVLQEYSEVRNLKTKLIVNKQNSGSAFKQWVKGIELARGDFLWIAEADDLCHPEFLSEMLSNANDENIILCDSAQIDENNKLLAENYQYYYSQAMQAYFTQGNSVAGPDFLDKCLSVKNFILNVSAVVFRRISLKSALKRIESDLQTFKIAGDWRLYYEILSQSGSTIKLVNRSLNTHRRHAASVTHSHYDLTQLQEIQRMHKLFSDKGVIDDSTKEEQREYIQELKAQFNL